MVSASTDFDVSVFNPQQATRLRCFNTGAAMFAVATVGVWAWCDSQCDDIVFAAGKDYVIHCYSLNAARFYQGDGAAVLRDAHSAPPHRLRRGCLPLR